MTLREEEEQIIQQHAPRFYMYAEGQYGGPIKYGQWKLFHQVGDNFQARFELVCVDAAQHMGYPLDAHPLDYWLDCLLVYLQNKNSRRLVTLDIDRWRLDNLCEISATYCARIEVESLYPHLRRSQAKVAPELPSVPRVAPAVIQDTKKQTVGEQIDQLREKCRWTEEELAEAVSLDVTTISRHIRGEMQPSLRNIRKYENAFSIELETNVVINQTPRKRL